MKGVGPKKALWQPHQEPKRGNTAQGLIRGQRESSFERWVIKKRTEGEEAVASRRGNVKEVRYSTISAFGTKNWCLIETDRYQWKSSRRGKDGRLGVSGVTARPSLISLWYRRKRVPDARVENTKMDQT